MAHVVVDTDGEACLRVGLGEFVVDGLDHSRREFLGRETVAAADHLRHSHLACHHGFGNSGQGILEERFASGTRFLAAVENGNLLDSLREGCNDGFHRERAVQADVDETDLFALPVEVLDGVTDGAGRRTHRNDYTFCISSTDVVHDVVLTASVASNLVHVLLDNFRNLCIERVHGFTTLEVNVRVLGGTAHSRAVRCEAALPACLHILFVDNVTDNAVFESFNLHHFVRSAEAVKEVHKRNAAFECRSVGHESEVLAFLDAAGGEHCKTRLAASHNVGVVTENGKALHSKSTGSHMEDRGGQFARNLVHVRDHQEKTLGCGEGRGEGTGLQSTVNGTGSATFGLHFKHAGNLSPNILLACSTPVVGVLSHRTRRCNRVNCSDFANRKCNASGGFVTVTRNHLFCHGYLRF